MVKTKELVQIETEIHAIEKGNLACPGCQLNLAFKHSLAALNNNAIVVIPACCTSVIQGAGKGYGMHVPIFNTAFASAPPVASGIARKLKLENKDTQVIVWAGDGGTSDIGFASLSGAAERNEDILYIMYNNQGYQNTGNQKSGATPRGAKTTTTMTGKTSKSKNIARILLAQDVPYVATANAAYPQDLFDKISKAAKEFKGNFRYIEIYSPCPPGWNIDSRNIVKVGKLANETGIWPLWESINGEVTLSKVSRRYLEKTNRKDPFEFFKLQGRFSGVDNDLIQQFMEDVEFEWKWLKKYLK
ncbi:MAG: thiamine pyrophosphate-dependent enzyme [Candidatus Heimdallarchaeota archaeon]|nr:thiamine pyrophosphate-dependent enzyme [Candidatus Heimdallarchaeota archaeon]MDH5644740.1 thiamine pyrophosphate-dependent enzyme [Candidatus Heimdallarchaeota archaeon]